VIRGREGVVLRRKTGKQEDDGMRKKRHYKDVIRGTMISLRLTQEEHLRLKMGALKEKMTVSKVMRRGVAALIEGAVAGPVAAPTGTLTGAPTEAATSTGMQPQTAASVPTEPRIAAVAAGAQSV
jgi:hypothetical protein